MLEIAGWTQRVSMYNRGMLQIRYGRYLSVMIHNSNIRHGESSTYYRRNSFKDAWLSIGSWGHRVAVTRIDLSRPILLHWSSCCVICCHLNWVLHARPFFDQCRLQFERRTRTELLPDLECCRVRLSYLVRYNTKFKEISNCIWTSTDRFLPSISHQTKTHARI